MFIGAFVGVHRRIYRGLQACRADRVTGVLWGCRGLQAYRVYRDI